MSAIKGSTRVSSGTKRSSSDANSAPPTKIALNVSKETLYEDLNQLEELEAVNRDPDEDAQVFTEKIEELRNIVSSVQEKKKKRPLSAKEIADARIKTMSCVLSLKKLNRLSKFRTKVMRVKTQHEMEKTDRIYDELQISDFELNHIKGEIQKCTSFRSRDEDISLISLDEYLKERDLNPNDVDPKDHQLHLDRLEHENQARRDLQSIIQTLKSDVAEKERQNEELRSKLSKVGPMLKDLLEATKPLQDFFGEPVLEENELFQMAVYLPKELYCLLSQIQSGALYLKNKTKIIIVGDLEEAKSFSAGLKGTQDEEREDDDVMDVSNADEESGKTEGHEDASSSHQRRSKKAHEEAFAIHPLKVNLQISNEEQDYSVTITFTYLLKLRAVGVITSLDLGDKYEKSSLATVEFLNNHNLLANLFSADNGKTNLNSVAKNVLSEVGLNVVPDSQAEKVGNLFKWAQHLAGYPCSANDEILTVLKQSRNTVMRPRNILEAINFRIVSRLCLFQQIQEIEKARNSSSPIQLPVFSSRQSNFASVCQVRSWSSVSWEGFRQLENAFHLVSGGGISSDDFLYRLQLNHDSNSLIALIAIKPNYPEESPVFCLNLFVNKNEYNMRNSENMRHFERHVNTYFPPLNDEEKLNLFSWQIRNLLITFESLNESFMEIEKKDRKRRAVVSKLMAGRSRTFPIVFNEELETVSHY